MSSLTNSIRTVIALCIFSAWQVAATVCVCTCNNIPTIVTGDCNPQACLTTFVAKDGYLNCTSAAQWTAQSLDGIIAGGSTLFQNLDSTTITLRLLTQPKNTGTVGGIVFIALVCCLAWCFCRAVCCCCCL
ncbi:hypothetical protein BC830DRAFT_1112995 [Chytriomyces sp. MP71]|nr:hypothetical protein BC830DRAFT_1112995 [Chytriomyces sp. MP71]